MTVYLIQVCGNDYYDNDEFVGEVFSTKEVAQRWIDERMDGDHMRWDYAPKCWKQCHKSDIHIIGVEVTE